jgi:hypothetical protein
MFVIEAVESLTVIACFHGAAIRRTGKSGREPRAELPCYAVFRSRQKTPFCK